MVTRDILDTALGRAHLTQNDAAAAVGLTPNQLSYKMANNTMRVELLIEILDKLGYDLALVDRSTGNTVPVVTFRNGHGRRVKNMFNHVLLDTKVASALSNSFYEDGEHEYREDGTAEELYVDKRGRYFITKYHADDPEKDQSKTVSASVAKEFIERYGTEIEKK